VGFFRQSRRSSMATPQVVNASAFQNALDEFKGSLSAKDSVDFTLTSLVDLQTCIKSIQDAQTRARKPKNLTRLKAFLEAMEEYSKVIEVFLNASGHSLLCVGTNFFLPACLLRIIASNSFPGPDEVPASGNALSQSDFSNPSLMRLGRLYLHRGIRRPA
jgi:hypothetical protein